MPLSEGRNGLADDLYAIWVDIEEEYTVEAEARRFAAAVHKYVLTGEPMTLITTFPGGVILEMTETIVTGIGDGGLDKRPLGKGLGNVRQKLEDDFVAIWSRYDEDYREIAEEMATAIHNYFREAQVLTKEKTDAPRPAPATSGPVEGVIKGRGGVFTREPGIGYAAARPPFEAELISIWYDIEDEYTIREYARRLSLAIHHFCIEGKVFMVGHFTAPADVNALTRNGVYFTGHGESDKGVLE